MFNLLRCPRGLRFWSLGTVASAFLLMTSAVVSETAAKTVKENTLSVGSDLTYPPFAYFDNGKPMGFDVELMQNIAQQMGLKSEFVDTRFASLITGLRANHFDAVASALYVTPERQKVVNFIPYLKAGSSLLVLKNSTYRPKTEKELCGKVVGSMQGASWLPKLKKLSDEHCVRNNLGAIVTREFDTDAQVTQALRSGAVEVEFMDNLVAVELLKKFPDDYVVTSSEIIYPVQIGIAFNQSNKELLTSIAEAFAKLRSSGTYKELASKYSVQTLTDAEINEVVSARQ